MENSVVAVGTQFGAMPMVPKTRFNSLRETGGFLREISQDGCRFGNPALLPETGASLFATIFPERIANSRRGEISFPVRWRDLARADIFMPKAPTPDPLKDEELMDVVAAYPCENPEHPSKPALSVDYETAVAAFEELQSRHFDRICGLMLSEGAGERAEEFALRAFFRIWEKRCYWKIGDPDNRFRGWSSTIAVNLLRDNIAPRILDLNRVPIDEPGHEISGDDEDPFDAAVVAEMEDLTGQCLRRLSPEEQQLLRLRYFLDLPRIAVAAILGITPRQVQYREEAALEKVRICLRGKKINSLGEILIEGRAEIPPGRADIPSGDDRRTQ